MLEYWKPYNRFVVLELFQYLKCFSHFSLSELGGCIQVEGRQGVLCILPIQHQKLF
eukprot:XP_001705145.1 Hypothetical protein GL50803_34697 [Giardia lamblia ATCC 50803]